MARNKKKINNKGYLSTALKYNILAIILFALGAISVLGLAGVNDPLSVNIYKATRLLFGHLFFLAPVFLGLAGLYLIAQTADRDSRMKRFNYSPIALAIFTVTLLSFLALINLVF